MAQRKFKKTFGAFPENVVVLSEVAKFDKDGVAEVSDEAADVLSHIPGYEEVLEDKKASEEDLKDAEDPKDDEVEDTEDPKDNEVEENTENLKDEEVEDTEEEAPKAPAKKPSKKATPRR